MVDVSTLPRINNRYQLLGALGTGGMGVVYRALDRLTGQDVALKQVTVATHQLNFASRFESDVDVQVALAHEFKTLASLRHPYIISVLDYGFDDARQPYFTMDLLENSQTLTVAGCEQPLLVQIKLLIQVLQALAYLHRRNILHRDLKPGNVLVVDKQVRVLDFGLSAARDQGEEMSGTLAYMAPELLMGMPASEASDLYAVGIMAYELLAGRHPFSSETNVQKLIYDILNEEPDIASLPVNEDIKQVVRRLLAKRAEERFSSASEIVAAYSDALGEALPYETPSTRESFLQAARFVGREAETKLLTDALANATAGKGSAWLIAGESGVGKSRLLDELRIQALVQGVLVLRGQAVSEGGQAYQPWYQPLRRLCLQTDLTEVQAGVLKAIVPDIDKLLNRHVADAPILDAQAAQDRLLNVIEHVFKQQRQPIMVVLEDLHWAGNESIAVLTRLQRSLSTLPLLIIGSYRDDERIDLPKLLVGAQVLKLSRLTEENIAELSKSILGESGREAAVVQLLQRETEGNAFFLVEVVRALAEEAGQLDQVGNMTLPQKVFAGGIQLVIQRRLSRIPESARFLLQPAAVAGRELDLSIIRALGPGVDLQHWLLVCSDAAVLDVNDGRWRFAHDKLREGLLADIGEDQRRALHRQVAQAIEQVYPNAPEHAANLANHWAIVGDTFKERYYAALAGEQALTRGALHEATRHLERALQLYGDILGPEPASIERQLGDAYWGLGRFDQSRQHLEHALAVMGRPLPRGPVGLTLSILGQLFLQIAHRIRPSLFVAKSSQRQELSLELCRNYIQLLKVYTFNNLFLPITHADLAGLNLGEVAGPSPELANCYASFCPLMGILGLRSVARFYSELSQKVAQPFIGDPGNLSTLSLTYSTLGWYATGDCDWVNADALLRRSIDMALEVGNRRPWGEALATRVFLLSMSSRYDEALQLTAELIPEAIKNDDPNIYLSALLPQIVLMVRQGKLADALPLLDEVKTRVQRGVGTATVIWAYGILALVYLRRGSLQDARQAAELALAAMRNSQPVSHWTIEGIAGVVETYMALWQKAAQPDEQKTLETSARQALKYLNGLARFFPIARPRSLLWRGVYKAASGQVPAAQKLWQKGLAQAEHLQMPYEVALFSFQLGKHLDASDPERKELLSKARSSFERLGAAYDLEQVQSIERSAPVPSTAK
jgi:eukaryotic-like serine/threonine-protein kinase